jgi:hypothetical protein
VEAELARLKGQSASREELQAPEDGEAEMRKDSMMAHLLDSLHAGKDIGHYGRLVCHGGATLHAAPGRARLAYM